MSEVLARDLNQLALLREDQDSNGDIDHLNDTSDEQLTQGIKTGEVQHIEEVMVEEINHMAPTGAAKQSTGARYQSNNYSCRGSE